MDNSGAFSRVLGKILAALLWLTGALLLTWELLRVYPGDSLLPVRYGGYLAPFLALLALLGLVDTIFLKNRYLLVFYALLSFMFAAPLAPQFLPRLHSQPVTSGDIKALTYSVMGRNRDYEAMARVIKSSKPDIFFVQEVRASVLLPRLADLYGAGEIYLVEGHGCFIGSRFPLQQINSNTGSPRAIATTPKGEIHLWGIHAPKALRNYSEQQRFFQMLYEEIVSTNGHRIVAGDFNSTTANEPCLMMEQVLDNAFDKAGWGLGFTFPTPARRMGKFFPFLRIDHIYYSNDFHALEAGTLDDNGGSDHYPVWARLGIVEKEKR